jgi:hypothetical protein
MLSTAVMNTAVVCADNELLHFDPPSSQTCGEYMSTYINTAGGYLQDANASTDCSFCQISETNTFLASVSSHPQHVWRNWGILWAYIAFNIFGAIFFYWLGRVPKNRGKGKKEVGATPSTSKDGSVLESEKTLRNDHHGVDRGLETAGHQTGDSSTRTTTPLKEGPEISEKTDHGIGAAR